MRAIDFQAKATEDQMCDGVRGLVTMRGGTMFHVRDSRRSPELENLPDWLIIAPWIETVLILEAKSMRRKITPGQQGVIDQLAVCTKLVTGIVRPVPHPGEIGYDEIVALLGGGL